MCHVYECAKDSSRYLKEPREARCGSTDAARGCSLVGGGQQPLSPSELGDKNLWYTNVLAAWQQSVRSGRVQGSSCIRNHALQEQWLADISKVKTERQAQKSCMSMSRRELEAVLLRSLSAMFEIAS
jgi:hypothetical protein